jgi:hypothetical protein
LKASQLCEAQDCNAKATMEVEVNAGTHGKIPLSLCAICVGKFEIIQEQKGKAPTARRPTRWNRSYDNMARRLKPRNVINT